MIDELPDFKPWPKISRLNRDIIVTEKIDGTNGVIYIGPIAVSGDTTFLVGSRTRWISPTNDNYGFAKWAYENKQELLKLGTGYHYGEWWGNSIQRGYGLPVGVKAFSLFNTFKWHPDSPKYQERPACCKVVPILYQGRWSEHEITKCLDDLRTNGSRIAPFLNPEGIVIYHTASNTSFKITLEGDEKAKGEKDE